jgi:transposase-like protein
MKKSINDPTNIARIAREHGVDPRLVRQRMRVKCMTGDIGGRKTLTSGWG